MNGTRNEKILAQERLHSAVFIIPAFIAAVTALPTFFALVMIHIATNEFTSVTNQLLNQQIRPSDSYLYIFAWVPTILCTLPTLAVTLVAYWKSTITLTSRRLTYRFGLLNIVAGELPLENVDAIFTVEHLLGRLFGFGTVIVTSVGGLRLPFRYIHSPDHFYQILNKAVSRVKAGELVEVADKIAVPPQNDDSRYMPKG